MPRRIALLLLFVVACALAPAAGAAAHPEVWAGRLGARVADSPFALTVLDARAGVVLRSAAGDGPGSALAFSAGGRWSRATHVIASRRTRVAYEAVLATDDPGGRRIALRIAPAGSGILRVSAAVTGAGAGEVEHVAAGFGAPPGERMLGFGERSNAVDQRGGAVENYVAEGPYLPPERPAMGAIIPVWGWLPRDDATYFPIPWLLSTRGYGVLVDNDETSRFRLGSDSPDTWSAEVDAPRIDMRVFAGPRPADALRRFSAAVGRQPPAAAPWYFGPWFQQHGGDQQSIERLRAADAPASVGQTYTHYLPCGGQVGHEDAERARSALYHANGLAVTTYFNPMVCTSYTAAFEPAAAAGALTRHPDGTPYVYRYFTSSFFDVGQYDFLRPAGVRMFGEQLAKAVDDGYDGWMEDFGEYTPTDAAPSGGLSGTAQHNAYATAYHRAAHLFALRAPRPLARFNRSGWTGAARHSQIVWGGDPSTTWGFDGLASAVRNGLTMGLSGVSLWGSDIGGFFTLTAPKLTPELLNRWIEVGFASGVMRTEADGIGGAGRPQIFDPDVLGTWRRYAKLRTQLYPYLAAAERDYDRTGLPLMRHLALAYPGDPRAAATDDEYLFGPDLLAAPVLEPGAAARGLYAPAGEWVDLWRSTRWLEQPGTLELARPALLRGPGEATVPAPQDELPLLVRAGAVLALLPADVDTLAPYRADGVVGLGERDGERRLLAFPRGVSRSALGPGEHALSLEGRGRWTLAIAGRRTRSWAVEAALGTLRAPFRPCAVRANGRPLPSSAWSYDDATTVLRATVRMRLGTLTAERCAGR
ncbi:MAG: glycoside hydrolase family 31 protein [Solirubrobacteraceae bacterium]